MKKFRIYTITLGRSIRMGQHCKGIMLIQHIVIASEEFLVHGAEWTEDPWLAKMIPYYVEIMGGNPFEVNV